MLWPARRSIGTLVPLVGILAGCGRQAAPLFKLLSPRHTNGTFTDKRAKSLKHTSFAGMGVDVADFNNDGWPDIAQMDMLPASLEQRKRMSGYLTYGGRIELRRRGFLDDFDNDGYKDLFATNGYPKAPNDLDYQTAVLAARRANDHRAALEQLRTLRSYRVANYIFRNNGDLTFTDETKAWGMDQPGFSFGAAYADLDNDGRLDLVVNNIDGPASIYENIQPADDAHHYLQVKLAGESPNRRGIG